MVVAIHRVALEARCLRGAVVAGLVVAPYEVLASLFVVEQFGSFNHASASQFGRGDTVCDNLPFVFPINQVG